MALRGAAFRILEERFGSWAALVAISSLFGLAHLGNPNATWLSTLAIGGTGGVGLGLALMLTRRLWFVIGMHAGVNLLPGAILGLKVSGNERSGLLVSELSGPELLTGGAFGLEASVPLLIAGVIAVAVLLHMVVRGKSTVVPWKLRSS